MDTVSDIQKAIVSALLAAVSRDLSLTIFLIPIRRKILAAKDGRTTIRNIEIIWFLMLILSAEKMCFIVF